MTCEGHPVGCDCMDCYEATQLEQLTKEMNELTTKLANASLDNSQRVAMQTRIHALENEQDRRAHPPNL